MYYIENSDKPCALSTIFGIVKLNDNILHVPVGEKELKIKKLKILAKRTNKILEKTNSKKIILAKELQNKEIYVNMLHSYGYNIVDGKWLFEALACDALNYIEKIKNIQKQQIQVSVLVNNLTDYTLENIKKLAGEYKSLNIVTNHLEKLKKVQDNIYSESGLMITVTNNKKKSLSKSSIILNIDFPNEIINKYNIFEEAIIVNINGNIKIIKKRFNGIVINDYEIEVKKDAIKNYNGNLNKYYTKQIYEAEFYQNIPYKDFREKIKKDNVKIQHLYGLNCKL